MTWVLTSSRMGTTAVLLGYALVTFSPEEANVWLLFLTVIGLQGVADSGFSQTFTRVFAFAIGGISTEQLSDLRRVQTVPGDGPDRDALCAIWGTARRVYRRLAVLWAALLLIGGSAALRGPLQHVTHPQEAWWAWVFVATVSVLWIYGAQYSAMLRGIGEVALHQRIGCVISFGQLTTSIVVLSLDGRLITLSIAYNSWFVIQVLLTTRYATSRLAYLIGGSKTGAFDPVVFAAVWPSVWRSGLGILMSYGLLQISGITYSQVAPAGESAAYLLAVRVLASINQFGQAPFYARLPQFATMRAAGRIDEQRCLAQSAMRISYWVLVAGVISAAVLADPLLKMLGANTGFVDSVFWILLACGGLVERYGAMHLQLYSTTNHILWHWINGISGFIFITVAVLAYPLLQYYAFPVAFCVSNIGFYGWFSARLSYATLEVPAWQFERHTLAAPLAVFAVSVCLILAF